MTEQKIHILGEEEIVSMLGLLGLEGSIIENEENFIRHFTELVKKPSIGMLIIASRLSQNIIEFLLEFKQNNRFPFIFILPDIFQPNIEKEDIIFNIINNAVGNITSS